MTQVTPHPTPSGEGELRSRLFSLIEPAIFNHDDTHYLDRALDGLEQLIAQECAARERAARVDELRHIEGDHVYSMMNGRPTYIDERIAQLAQAQGGQS